MQIQVHTNDNIQGGESLIRWAQDEAAAKLARFREHVTRVELFLSDVDAGKSGVDDKRCVIEARPAGRQPVAATAEAAKVATTKGFQSVYWLRGGLPEWDETGLPTEGG